MWRADYMMSQIKVVMFVMPDTSICFIPSPSKKV